MVRFNEASILSLICDTVTATIFTGDLSGNAESATKLKNARTINGTSFNGTGNITTANWGTARTLTIGNTGKSVNGSGNVSWSLSEIGALPLSGGTMTGDLVMKNVRLTDGVHNRIVMQIFDDGDEDNYGSELVIGGAGNSFFGSGEAPSNLRKHYQTDGSERLGLEAYGITSENTYIAADTFIYLIAGCGTIANRNGFRVSSNTFAPLSDYNAYLGSTSYAFINAYSRYFSLQYNGVNYGLLRVNTEGTSSTVGISDLVLGNGTISGTDGNARGRIILYNSNANYAALHTHNDTASNITLYLPSAGGTLARTADNVASATKLQTARNIYITDSAGSSTGTAVSFNGTANVTLKLPSIIRCKTNGVVSTTWGLGESPSEAIWFTHNDGLDKNLLPVTSRQTAIYTNGRVLNRVIARYIGDDGKTYDSVLSAVACPDGTIFAEAPTPSVVNDNSTKIATTAWVNSYNAKYFMPLAGGSFSGTVKTKDLVPVTHSAYHVGNLDNPYNTVYTNHVWLVRQNTSKFYGKFYITTTGTTSAVGQAKLELGNGTASGTAENAKGVLVMFGSGAGYTLFTPANTSATNYTITIPAATGTLALTSSSITGNAKTATTLQNARNFRINLASTDTASFNGSADCTPGVTGTLPVANGGTGATTFTSGAALIGNGTSAVTTRAITNMTTKSHITYNTNLMTTNTLAYWNGAYSSGNASNLAYCVKGAFGTAATYDVTTSITSGSSALITSGAVYTGLAGKADNSHTHSYLPLSGGTLTGNITISKSGPRYIAKDTSATLGTTPTSNKWNAVLLIADNNGKNMGAIEHGYKTTGELRMNLMCYNHDSSSNVQIACGYDVNDSWFTYCPTPGKSSNTTHIATTAFVKNNLADYLPLSGGTMTGTITATAIATTKDGGYNVGSSTYAFNVGCFRALRIYYGGTQYGTLFMQTSGTTSAVGNCRLTLGNSSASGTENNARGDILMYDSNKYWCNIKTNGNLTGNRTITVPNKSGEIALKTDVDAVLKSEFVCVPNPVGIWGWWYTTNGTTPTYSYARVNGVTCSMSVTVPDDSTGNVRAETVVIVPYYILAGTSFTVKVNITAFTSTTDNLNHGFVISYRDFSNTVRTLKTMTEPDNGTYTYSGSVSSYDIKDIVFVLQSYGAAGQKASITFTAIINNEAVVFNL